MSFEPWGFSADNSTTSSFLPRHRPSQLAELSHSAYVKFSSPGDFQPTILLHLRSEVKFVNAVTAGGSVKFLPAV